MSEPARPLADKVVLVVDDEAPLLNMVVRRLRHGGVTCLSATGAFRALDILDQEVVDIVVSDICMPEGDGVALLHGIRKRSLDVITVMVTGFSDYTRADLVALGADEVLAKPFRIGELLETLGALVGGGRAQRLESAVPALSASGDCPFTERCPMFPVFRNRPALAMYQEAYCRSDFGSCARYKLASEGTMPPPILLPDGTTLPQHWAADS